MSFWSGYWQSLKVRAVEEPIDVWLHRPLGYLLARAALPTRITPNGITLLSTLCGVAGGVLLFLDFPWRAQCAAACIFLSAVLDCADGQLARMRGVSSLLGRMLDGVADFAVIVGVGLGSTWVFWNDHREPPLEGAVALLLSLLMALTGPRHTAMYDHYKSLYLALTEPGYQDADDYESAKRRRQGSARGELLAERLTWPVYLYYLNGQAGFVRSFDPFTTTELHKLGPFDPVRAAIYRRHAEPLLRLWRGWFGFGSLIFGFAVSIAFDALDVYIAFRLLGLHSLYYLYMRPTQRRASQHAFQEMARAGVGLDVGVAAPSALG